jgi:N-acetylglutamate synthase-like GNAT family acetyltransferase
MMDECLAIRLAQPDEREVLEGLQRRAYLANAGDRDALLANPDESISRHQIEAHQVFVGERGALIVGFAAVLVRCDGDVDLDGLFVDPELWRTSVGKALVNQCVRHACEHGGQALHVIGNPQRDVFTLRASSKSQEPWDTRFGPGLSMKMAVCRARGKWVAGYLPTPRKLFENCRLLF